MACCSKAICNGCDYANTSREFVGKLDPMSFCRQKFAPSCRSGVEFVPMIVLGGIIKGGEGDDIAALIYRESQLRKKEAAATAAKNERNSASTRQATSSTRRAAARAAAAICGNDSSAVAPGRKMVAKRKRH
eukprot:scaffold4065_cov161-Skeletonema_dohrnii-CCMP3373.AAC.3